ncbi:MAG: hypothetical protein ACRDZX_09655 [Acidimicrobiales bacterium]
MRWAWQRLPAITGALALTVVPSAAAGLVVAPRSAGAQAPGRQAAGGGPRVSLGLSSLYSVSVAPGSWVPVVVSVSDRGGSELRGDLVVRAPVSQVVQPSQACYKSGRNFACMSGGWFAYAPLTGYSSAPSVGDVHYKIRFDLAPATTKRFVTDVVAETSAASVRAEAVSAAGQVLARAKYQLALQSGVPVPDVLVVTGSPAQLSSLSLPAPDGAQPQVQLLAPSEVPASSVALGAFSAILVDQADTSSFSSAQGRALQGYVQSGGTLVVAGGLGWRSAVAGLPPGLLPARSAGTTTVALARLAKLLGSEPPAAPAPVDRLRAGAGSEVVLSQGGLPLAVQAQRGSGYVVVSALDPAAAPLSGWAAEPALASRLLAPAYQTYYGEGGSSAPYSGILGATSSPYWVNPLVVPFAGVTSVFGPGPASSALGPYLEQMPGTSLPSAALLGLLLLGYVVVAGPACWLVLRHLRRRELAWAAVPSLALVVGLAAYLTGAGMARSPLGDEVQVAQLVPGSNVAQVTSVGAVYLPRGGSSHVSLAGYSDVSDLGANAGALLTVDPGAAPATSGLVISGPDNTLGGWAASRDETLGGTLEARMEQLPGAVSGTVTNDLGATLTNVYLVTASGSTHLLGKLPPGATARFRFSLPAAGTGLAGPIYSGPPPGATALFARQPGGPYSAGARAEQATAGLVQLASEYWRSGAAGPVLVGLARSPFLPRGTGATSGPVSALDAVVVPLPLSYRPGSKLTGVPAELVGSHGLTGQRPGTGPAPSFTVAKGGSLYYQFLLPASGLKELVVDLGSPNGSGPSAANGPVNGLAVSAGAGALGVSTGSSSGLATSTASPGDFALSAFDYSTGSWSVLRVRTAGGQLRALISSPSEHLGPGGAVELRLSARRSGLEVLGPVPSLSARPEGP